MTRGLGKRPWEASSSYQARAPPLVPPLVSPWCPPGAPLVLQENAGTRARTKKGLWLAVSCHAPAGMNLKADGLPLRHRVRDIGGKQHLFINLLCFFDVSLLTASSGLFKAFWGLL